MRTLFRHPGRLWRVLVVFSRYFILPKLPFRSPPEPGAVRMRLASRSSAARGSSSARCWRCASTCCRRRTAPSCSSCSSQVRPFSYDEVRDDRDGGARRLRRRKSSRRSSSAPSPPLRSARSIARSSIPASQSRSRSSARASAPIFRSDIGLMYAVSGFSTGRTCSGGRIAAGHRRVRALDGRRARLSRRGAPGSAPP